MLEYMMYPPEKFQLFWSLVKKKYIFKVRMFNAWINTKYDHWSAIDIYVCTCFIKILPRAPEELETSRGKVILKPADAVVTPHADSSV